MMEILKQKTTWHLQKEGQTVATCQFTPTQYGANITAFDFLPQWQGKGYEVYLLKALLNDTHGYDKGQESLHTIPLDTCCAPTILQKTGFRKEDAQWVRQRKQDPTAISTMQTFVREHLTRCVAAQPDAPLFCIDATCGNGHDTLFLAQTLAQFSSPPHGSPIPVDLSSAQTAPCDVTAFHRLLALDIQPSAIESTWKMLLTHDATSPQIDLVCDNHKNLAQHTNGAAADVIIFNFGWLPGADHQIFSQAESSIPALESAFACLKTGGLLAATLYSGSVIGDAEKEAILSFFQNLPITQYTVLICTFANWDKTAPLPCFIWKK